MNENKLVCGKQCTLVWYVDNNKVSHIESEVVDYLINYFFEAIFIVSKE